MRLIDGAGRHFPRGQHLCSLDRVADGPMHSIWDGDVQDMWRDWLSTKFPECSFGAEESCALLEELAEDEGGDSVVDVDSAEAPSDTLPESECDINGLSQQECEDDGGGDGFPSALDAANEVLGDGDGGDGGEE